MSRPAVPAPEQLLRQAGLRLTRPRLAVLAALAANPHPGAETLLGVVRRELGGVSTQARPDLTRPATTRPATTNKE